MDECTPVQMFHVSLVTRTFLWLANQGVPLKSWQEWVDRATSLWMERNRSNLNTSKIQTYLFLLFPIIMILTFVSVALLPWESKVYGTAIAFPSALLIIIALIILSRKAQSDFLQIEDKWSDLVQDINRGICKDLGIHVKLKQDQQHYYRSHSTGDNIHSSMTHYSISYSVGLIFMIEPGRQQP
jgi:hypothetical protein